MKTVALIAIGGAAGAVLRFLCVHWVSLWTGNSWATFVVNFVGCFAIGILIGSVGHMTWFNDYGRPLFVIGLLGGFTTYSTFSMDVLNLLQDGKMTMAVVYVLATTAGCLLSAFVGYRMGVA